METNRYDPASADHPRACPFYLGDLGERRYPTDIDVCGFWCQRSGMARRVLGRPSREAPELAPPVVQAPAA